MNFISCLIDNTNQRTAVKYSDSSDLIGPTGHNMSKTYVLGALLVASAVVS